MLNTSEDSMPKEASSQELETLLLEAQQAMDLSEAGAAIVLAAEKEMSASSPVPQPPPQPLP